MARLNRLIQGALVSGVAAALALACSASSGGSHFGGSGGSGNGSNSGGSGAGVSLGGSTNNGGSGAGNGGSINLGGSSNGGSGASMGGDACAATHSTGQQLPLDMYIMMDESGSMADGTPTSKWDGVKSALTSFVNAGAPVAGIGVGIQFFPPLSGGTGCVPAVPPCGTGCIAIGGLCFPTGSGGAECNPQTYLPPAVTIQPLPGVAQQIINAMNAHSPNGGTPTLPAMQSAVQATTAYAKQHPDHKVIIVLATDGEPNDCNSTVANVSQEAATALASTPSVMTFVIGIGTVSNMDQIAQAGGSGKSYQVDAANANQTFLDAMNKIRGTALGCDYLLPKPTNGGTINYGMVNVYYTPNGGQKQLIYYVGGASGCTSKGGWYYDVSPTKGTPTKIIFCPASCSGVQGTQGAVDIKVGCEVSQPPPS